MEEKMKIAVLGFGRSGTTWISDIISKVSGSLVLFEPFHPSVTDKSKYYSYSNGDKNNGNMILSYLDTIINKEVQKRWLLRNHVQIKIDDVKDYFLDYIWKNCDIIGFKDIRMNFMIGLLWLYRYKIVYIIRHPYSVISSILKRENFWEFGWPKTLELFMSKRNYNGKIYDTIHENIALMWSLTQENVLPLIKALGIPLFYYEYFYAYPFEATRNLMDYLKISNNIHPAHIFTPSMTTMRTYHGIYDLNIIKDNSIFWEDILDKKMKKEIYDVVSMFDLNRYLKNIYFT